MADFQNLLEDGSLLCLLGDAGCSLTLLGFVGGLCSGSSMWPPGLPRSTGAGFQVYREKWAAF